LLSTIRITHRSPTDVKGFALKLDLITTLDGFDALQPEWNHLLPTSSTNQIFLTYQWQRTWWNAYQPGELFIVAGRDDAGTLIGIAPWFIEAGTRTMRGIGCVDVTDYLDVIAPAEHREAFFGEVVNLLAAKADQFSTLDLCNIPQESETLDVLPRFLTDRGFSLQIKQQEVCPFIALPEDFEGYLAQLDKKQRHECRRKLRRIEENKADKIAWYIVGREHNLDEEIDKFLDLMRASHPEKAEFLKNEQHLTFFRTMVHQVARCGWLQLSFLTVNDMPVSTYMNFDFNNRILVYNSGLLPEGYSQFSPGIVLLLYNIQHAIELRRPVFDFLRGNEEYKYRMGGKDRPVMNLEATLSK
jgi:CelD/BcsL family acetyltransferase involved in cellulose biosynthesis